LASVETRAYRAAITVGQEGREMGQFRQPGGVVVDQTNRIYVADTYNHRIQVFAPDGRFLQAFGMEGTQRGALLRPKGLAWGSPSMPNSSCISRIRRTIGCKNLRRMGGSS
jgi:DNA-binding beta-propeller fold protein YncE